MKLRKFYRGYNPEYPHLGSYNHGWWMTKNPEYALHVGLSNKKTAIEIFYLDMDNTKIANISKLVKMDPKFSYMDQIPEQVDKVLKAGYDGFKNGHGDICLLNLDKIVKHYRVPWKEMELKLRKMGYLYDEENNINNIPDWVQQNIDDGYETLEDVYDENGRYTDYTIEKIREKYVESKYRKLKKIISESVKKTIKDMTDIR